METFHAPDAPAPRPAGAPGTLMDRMGMEVVELSAERTVLTMPVAGNVQSAGILHGGASAALAETAGSFAAAAHARRITGDPNVRVVGVELSISHLRAGAGDRVTATARAVHLGGTSAVHVVDVTDGRGRLVASARISNRIL